MDADALRSIVCYIVDQATILKDKHIDAPYAAVNYACIFSQCQEEYDELLAGAHTLGEVIDTMASGLLFRIDPLQTVSGVLHLLKIRISDPTRPERGYADFTIPDFSTFEKTYGCRQGFSRMDKKNFYMLELVDPAFDVRAYFSNPPLDVQLGIK